MFINKVGAYHNLKTFKGYQHQKDNTGRDVLNFYYPFDSEKENCEIKIYRAFPNENYNYQIDSKPIATINVDKNGTPVHPSDIGLTSTDPFAYRVVRRDKETNKVLWEGADTGVKVKYDNGEFVFRNSDAMSDNVLSVTDENGKVIKFNERNFADKVENYSHTLVTRYGTSPKTMGSAYLAIPDSFIPGAKYKGFNDENTGEVYFDEAAQKLAESQQRSFSNRFGGNLAGLELGIPYLKKNGYKVLFTTPMNNGDDLSSHSYWNKNNMQIASTMGNSENFKSLMENLYANGMKYVFDGTFTSEGLEGIHFQYALRWAQQNPQTAYWFKMAGLKKGALGLGVVPKNKENLRFRVINSPYVYNEAKGKIEKNREGYDPNKETLFQIYDASLVSEDKLKDLDKPIRIYDELKSGKELDINTHNDTLISYVFQIKPSEYKESLEAFIEHNKNLSSPIKANSPEGTILISQFSNFKLINKTTGGFVTWDANTDMAKMNFKISGYDEKELQNSEKISGRAYNRELLERGSYEASDLVMQAGAYWTGLVKDILFSYTARTLANAKTENDIKALIDNNKLPKECALSAEELANIEDGWYNLKPKGIMQKSDVTLKALMSLPLDSLEFADNTVGVLSTSYFSNRATTEDTVGVSRFELMKKLNPHLVEPYRSTYLKMQALYENELLDFTNDVIRQLDANLSNKLLDENDKYTEYGEYVVEAVAKDIAKYALLKSLSGEAFKVKLDKDGRLTYDYEAIKNATSLANLGINASNPTSEANELASKITKGLDKLSKDDSKYLADIFAKQFAGTDVQSFRIAEAMIEKASYGANWRLDAAKDIQDQDAVRNGENDFDDTMKDCITFWKKFVAGVKKQNPNSYIVAEITDIEDLMKDKYGADSIPYNGLTNIGSAFNGEPDFTSKFFNETGITSEAGYSYFFTSIATLFSNNFENGRGFDSSHSGFKSRLAYLMQTRSADYLRNLYTFVGNHDKPRMAHCFALDMALFHSKMLNDYNNFAENHNYRQDAIKALTGVQDVTSIPIELRLNVDNNDYFKTVSPRAVAMTKLLLGSVNEDIDSITTPEQRQLLASALVDLTNGNYMGTGSNVNLNTISIPELTDIKTGFSKILSYAVCHGLILRPDEKVALLEQIVQKAKDDEFVQKFLVQGDFEWGDSKVSDRNKKFANEVLLNTPSDYSRYSVYTVCYARLLLEAFNNTPYLKNANVNKAIKAGINDFVKKYDRNTVNAGRKYIPQTDTAINAYRKNKYAASDISKVLEMMINQAEYKSGREFINKAEVIKKMEDSILEPAMTKAAMAMRVLTALPGIPTMYAGDEQGMTGYDEKAKNIYLQNRNALKYNSDSKYQDILNDIMSVRNQNGLEVMNNGTPYELTTSNDAVPAYLMYGKDGQAAISVFNLCGMDSDNRKNYFDLHNLKSKDDVQRFMKENDIDSMNINNPYIPIQEKTEIDSILLPASVALAVGTVFVNSDIRDAAEYVVKRTGDGLKRLALFRKDGGKIILNGKTAKFGAMILKKKV